MQPYVFPYIGYMQLVHAADKFVFYDDVNFIKKGWINRNSIMLNDGSYRFTIPLKGQSQNSLIKDIEPLNLEVFKEKFRIRQSFGVFGGKKIFWRWYF